MNRPPRSLVAEGEQGPPPDRREFQIHSALLLTAQFVLLVGGYLIHLGVGRLLGPAEYGAFGLVSTLLFWTETALYGGFLLGISRTVAEDPQVARSVWKTVSIGIALASLLVWLAAILLARPMAGLLGDPGIAPLFLPGFLDVLPFCLYNVSLGVLDGSRAFAQRAACSVLYMGAKVLCTVGLLLKGYGAEGALLGNAFGSVVGMAVVLPLAFRLSGRGEMASLERGRIALKSVLRQAAPVGLFSVAVQALLSMDLLVLGHLVTDRERVGLYLGAASLAKAPYFLLSAQAGVLVPLIAAALARRNEAGKEEAALYLNRELRFAILLLLPSLALVAGTAPEAVVLALGPRFESAGRILPVLVAGLMSLGLFRALATAAMAGARNAAVLGMLVSALVLDAILCFALIPRFGMVGASFATGIAATAATAAALVYLRTLFAYRFPWKTLARVGGASLLGFLVSAGIDAAGWPVILAWLGGTIIMGLMLWGTGEWRGKRGGLATNG